MKICFKKVKHKRNTKHIFRNVRFKNIFRMCGVETLMMMMPTYKSACMPKELVLQIGLVTFLCFNLSTIIETSLLHIKQPNFVKPTSYPEFILIFKWRANCPENCKVQVSLRKFNKLHDKKMILQFQNVGI